MDHKIKQTFSPRVISLAQGDRVFAVDYDQALFKRHLSAPVLSSGSSLLTLQKLFDHVSADALGRGLIAESVNQLLIYGAEPVFVALEAWGMPPAMYDLFMKGCVDACRLAGCALQCHGPGVRPSEERGAAACSVGVSDLNKRIRFPGMQAGDHVLGIAAEGALPGELAAADLSGPRLTGVKGAAPLNRKLHRVLGAYRIKRPVHTLFAADYAADAMCLDQRPRGMVRMIRDKLPDGLSLALHEDSFSAWEQALAPFWPPKSRGIDRVLEKRNCGLAVMLVVGPHFFEGIRRRLKRCGLLCLHLGQIE